MWNLQVWWSGLTAFEKAVAGVAGVLAGLKAVWNPGKASFDWMIERYDAPVLRVLKGRARLARMSPGFVDAVPVSAHFIANAASRTPKSVIKSLRRLERKGVVREGRYGWQFGLEPIVQDAGVKAWEAPWEKLHAPSCAASRVKARVLGTMIE